MFGFSWFKIISYGVTAIFALSIGWGLSEMIKVKPLQAEVKEKQAEIYVLKEAYETNRVAIETLKDNINTQKTIADKRLGAKDKLLKDCLSTCGLHSGGSYENPTGDSLLDRLNSVFMQSK